MLSERNKIPVTGWSGGMAHMAGLSFFLILPSIISTASLPLSACEIFAISGSSKYNKTSGK